MHNPNGLLPHCYLMARDHKAQPCHSGRSKHTRVCMVTWPCTCTHRGYRGRVLVMDSAAMIFLYHHLASPQFPPSSFSFRGGQRLWACPHTQTHTLLHGPSFLPLTFSFFPYLFHTDKIQFTTDLWEFVCACVCFWGDVHSCQCTHAFII